MKSVERFQELAASDRFKKGWPETGESSITPIPFFGSAYNYQLVTGNGVEPYTSILRHFGWAVVFGVVDGMVPTLCQWKPGVNRASWELPPGGIGKVSSEATAEQITEITRQAYLKETGLGGGEFKHLGVIGIETGKYRGASSIDHGFFAHLFLADGLRQIQHARNPNANEIMETIMVPLGELRAVLESGLFIEESAVVCAYQALIKLGALTWAP